MLKLDIQLFAVPFRKVSKTRKRMRRSHNALTMPGMVACKECGEMIKPHRACPKCGSYKGKTVVAKKESTEEFMFCLLFCTWMNSDDMVLKRVW